MITKAYASSNSELAKTSESLSPTNYDDISLSSSSNPDTIALTTSVSNLLNLSWYEALHISQSLLPLTFSLTQEALSSLLNLSQNITFGTLERHTLASGSGQIVDLEELPDTSSESFVLFTTPESVAIEEDVDPLEKILGIFDDEIVDMSTSVRDTMNELHKWQNASID